MFEDVRAVVLCATLSDYDQVCIAPDNRGSGTLLQNKFLSGKPGQRTRLPSMRHSSLSGRFSSGMRKRKRITVVHQRINFTVQT
ncbi:hypothetical protein K1719_017076 [Acacia pycnantha]|nr:hypothetical protein K1719_017076 [Acacia pycnantha]